MAAILNMPSYFYNCRGCAEDGLLSYVSLFIRFPSFIVAKAWHAAYDPHQKFP